MVANLQGQAHSGAEAWAFDDIDDVNYQNQGANLVTENAQVLAGIDASHIPLVNYRPRPAGTPFFSHARVASVGNILIAFGVSAGAPENADNIDLRYGRLATALVRNPPGSIDVTALRTQAAWSVLVSPAGVDIEPGLIAANSTESGVSSFGDVGGVFALASPRNALPAGIAYSHCRENDGAGETEVFLHNLTDGGIDPGQVPFDMIFLRPTILSNTPVANTVRPRRGASGLITIVTVPLVLAATGAIPAAETAEFAFTIPGTAGNARIPIQPRVGTVAMYTPNAALAAGVALSHVRVTGPTTAALGLADVTGAGIADAGAQAGQLTLFIPPER